MIDYVGSGIILLLSQGLTFIGGRKVPCIVHEDLAIWINSLDTLFESCLELFDERELHAANESKDILAISLGLESRCHAH